MSLDVLHARARIASICIRPSSTQVEMDLKCKQENTNEAEVKKRMNEYGCTTRLKVAELNTS